MKVSILTPTGGRQKLMPLYYNWIAQQTYKGELEVILVDDVGDVGLPVDARRTKYKLIPGPRNWEPGLNTQRYNLEEGIKHVTGDILILAEDDDWFAPEYIQTVVDQLSCVDAFGLSFARYYNVTIPGYKTSHNVAHAALSQTAIKTTHLDLLKKAINSGEFYVDVKLWEYLREKEVAFALLANTTLGIGMKGLPGKAGLTPTHKNKKDFMFDSNLVKLTQWLGKDAELYRQFTRYKLKEPPHAVNQKRQENQEEFR